MNRKFLGIGLGLFLFLSRLAWSQDNSDLRSCGWHVVASTRGKLTSVQVLKPSEAALLGAIPATHPLSDEALKEIDRAPRRFFTLMDGSGGYHGLMGVELIPTSSGSTVKERIAVLTLITEVPWDHLDVAIEGIRRSLESDNYTLAIQQGAEAGMIWNGLEYEVFDQTRIPTEGEELPYQTAPSTVFPTKLREARHFRKVSPYPSRHRIRFELQPVPISSKHQDSLFTAAAELSRSIIPFGRMRFVNSQRYLQWRKLVATTNTTAIMERWLRTRKPADAPLRRLITLDAWLNENKALPVILQRLNRMERLALIEEILAHREWRERLRQIESPASLLVALRRTEIVSRLGGFLGADRMDLCQRVLADEKISNEVAEWVVSLLSQRRSETSFGAASTILKALPKTVTYHDVKLELRDNLINHIVPSVLARQAGRFLIEGDDRVSAFASEILTYLQKFRNVPEESFEFLRQFVGGATTRLEAVKKWLGNSEVDAEKKVKLLLFFVTSEVYDELFESIDSHDQDRVEQLLSLQSFAPAVKKAAVKHGMFDTIFRQLLPESFDLVPFPISSRGEIVFLGTTGSNLRGGRLTRSFHFQATPVTVGQYLIYIGATKAHCMNSIRTRDLNEPVTHVSWLDAYYFREWMAKLDPTGLWRLPYEAEWEYLAQTKFPLNRSSENDHEKDRLGWYEKNSGNRVHRVATKGPNGLGIFDMHGNVLNWMLDPWEDALTSDSPIYPDVRAFQNRYRVARGAHFLSYSKDMWPDVRHCVYSVTRNEFVGFRLVREDRKE